VCFDVRWCERRDGVKWFEMGEDPSGKAKVTWVWMQSNLDVEVLIFGWLLCVLCVF
jgi:hypothetical protein